MTKSRGMRWVCNIAYMEESLKETKTLRRPRNRWEIIIKMNLMKTGLEGYGSAVGYCEHHSEPSGSKKTGI
jgi:hypothetical protein